MTVAAPPPDHERVQGLKAIAEVLGCSVATVQRLLRRPFDPVRFRCGPLRLLRADYEREPWYPRSRLLAFRRRWQTPDDPALLATVVEGWVRVARIARVSVDLAQALAAREVDPLPVWYTRTGRVRALPCALRDWYDAHHGPHIEPGQEMRSGAEPEAATGDRARSGSGFGTDDKGPAKVGRRRAA
jgi:hypothetical protein